MSEFKQKITCSYCGEKQAVTVITKQTSTSRSIKVTKCEKCKMQSAKREA